MSGEFFHKIIQKKGRFETKTRILLYFFWQQMDKNEKFWVVWGQKSAEEISSFTLNDVRVECINFWKMFQKTLVFVCVLLMLSSINAQDWADFNTDTDIDFDGVEGALLSHLYSTPITLAPATGATLVDTTATFTLTIPEGVFVSTEQIYIVISLLSLDVAAGSVGVGTTKTLFVDSYSVNAARTQFSMTVKAQEDLPGSVLSEYQQLTYSILLIGSDFDGYSTTLESSYVYGKIGTLEEVDPAVDDRQFSFETTTEGSPFNYLPDADLGSGCGMIRKSGNIIIEELDCDLSKFYVFITGFVITADAAHEMSISSWLQVDATSVIQYENHDSTTIYKENSLDNLYGLFVAYNDLARTTILSKLQLSFVHFGVRSYDVASYPTQPVNADTFKVYSKSVMELPLFAGGGGSPNTELSPIEVNPQDPFQAVRPYGHTFCGLDQLELATGQNALYTTLSDVDQTSTTINLEIYTDAAYAAAFALTQFKTSYACLLFRRADICEQTSDLVPLVLTTDRITITDNFAVAPTLTGSTTGATIPADLSPELKFSFSPLTALESTLTITLKYNRAASGDSLFFGYLAIPAVEIGEHVKLTVFGDVIRDEVLEAAAALLEFSFYTHNSDLTQDTVVIEWTGNRAAPVADVLSFALRSYDKVIDGVECVQSCPARTGFVTGFDITNQPFTCLYCDTSLFETFDFETATCVCQDRYVRDANQVCQPCVDTLCAECADETAAAVCNDCVNYAQQSGGGQCVCNANYYANAGACVTCPNGCQACSSATTCGSCVDGEGTRDTPSNGCVCLAGYYDDGTSAVCPQCSVECQTCSGTATNCVTCNTAGNFEVVGTTCRCIDGYYELRTDTTATCEPCDSTCLTCEISALQCTSCDEDNQFRQLTAARTCQCKTGYIQLLGDCVDQTCQSVTPNCQSCAYDPFTQTSECLGCSGNRIVVGGACECKVGFFENNGNCDACETGCQQCAVDNTGAFPTFCLVCALKAVNNGDGSCGCGDGTVLVEAAGTLYCRPCSSACATCQGTYDNCQSCNAPFIQNQAGNSCVCPDGTYRSNDQCLPCSANCNKCTSPSSCDQCATHYVFDGSKCDLSCPDGMYKGASECLNCATGCARCTSAYQCSQCSTGFNLFAGSCRENCPESTFASGGICYSCVSPCKSCSGSGQACTSCVSTHVYFNGQCLSDCPTGTFFADGSCLVCSSSCLTCSGTSTYCTSCPDGQHQYKNGCYAQCPGVIVSGRCTDRCADGQFASGGSCSPCDAKCEACSGSATNCTRCANGFMSYAGDCVDTCPTGYFPSSGVCLQCDVSCNGCSGSPFICNSCAVGYVRSGNRCIEGCAQGQYIDFRSNTCDFCGEGCKVCSSPTQCSQCIDPTLVPLNGVCKKSCPPGAQLVGDTCVCTFGSYFSGACISSCLDGYYSRNRVCEACQPPCRLCSGTATYCLSCVSGYDLDTATNTCVRISKCKYGQYEDTTGTCRRRCINKFYYNTVCLTTCPPGFKDNGFGGCVDEPNQSICKAPQFQQGSTCVSACQVGFYPDYVSRICQKCPANCFLCNGPSLCFQCLPGYVPIHGKCEVSLGCLPGQVQFNDLCWDGCPIGTYLESNTCMRACPEKHYYYNGLCYPSCPAQASHNTPDACVANCAGIPLCI